MKKRIIAAMLLTTLLTGCSKTVETSTTDTVVTSDTMPVITMTAAETIPEENEEALTYITNAENYLMNDDVKLAMEAAMNGYDCALYPDDTNLAFVLSELLGTYDVGNTYRATCSFNIEDIVDENTIIKSYPGSKYISIQNGTNVKIYDVERHYLLHTLELNPEVNQCAFINEYLFAYCGPDGEGMYGEYAINLNDGSSCQYELGPNLDSCVLADGNGNGVFLNYESGYALYLTPTEEDNFAMGICEFSDLMNCEPDNVLFEKGTMIVAKENAIYGFDLVQKKRIFRIDVKSASLLAAASMGEKLLLAYMNGDDCQIEVIEGDSIIEVDSEGLWVNEICTISGYEDSYYICSSTAILEMNAETNEVSNSIKFDNSIVSILTMDGNVNVILADGRIQQAFRCVGLTSNFVCHANDIIDASICDDGFAIVQRDEKRIILYSPIDSPMSVTVTATDSDSMRPEAMSTDDKGLYICENMRIGENDGKVAIYMDGSLVSEFELQSGFPTMAVSYGGYSILYDSSSGIGYIMKGTLLVGITHNFVSLDPSDMSVYIGTDVMHKIFILDCAELVDMVK